MAANEFLVTQLPSADDIRKTGLTKFIDRVIRPWKRGKAPPAQPAMGFYTDTTVCIGCKACEVACKQWNQLPADDFKYSGNSYDNTGTLSADSWRHVKFIEQFPSEGIDPHHRQPDPVPVSTRMSLDVVAAPEPARWLMMSDVCKHCVTAPCQQACPTGAILYNEFGNVYIQPDICNGCAYCIAACPFGVITRSHFDGLTHKCTLCYDRQKDGLVPACAKACPTASIQFGPIDELKAKAEKRVEQLKERNVPGAYLYGDKPTETYSQLNSFYLLVDTPETYGLPKDAFNPWLNMKGDYLRSVVGMVGGLVALAVIFVAMGS